MRKLILLVVAGAVLAYLFRSRSEPQPAWSATEAATSDYAPGPESAAETPPTEEVAPEPEDEQAEEVTPTEDDEQGDELAAGEADTLETDRLRLPPEEEAG